MGGVRADCHRLIPVRLLAAAVRATLAALTGGNFVYTEQAEVLGS